jgi:hypothetical protein
MRGTIRIEERRAMSGAAMKPADYALPGGKLGLDGPVEKPAPGTLPLRGDLAHIALAGTHLAAHYVIPDRSMVNGNGAPLRLVPREDSEALLMLNAGTDIEVLDIAGEWVWATIGPAGPSGYLKLAELA